jgi:DNA-binding MarR family transcriptional regulator
VTTKKPVRRSVRAQQHATAPLARTTAPPTTAARGAPRESAAPGAKADAQLNAAEPVVQYLGGLIRWARLRSFELLERRAGVDVDRSGIIILTTLHRIGPMRMSDLAADIGLDRSTISRQVGAVVRGGFVQKMDDSADARASLLTLTARGQAARKKLADAWHDMVLELLEGWSHEEQADLARLLGKLAYQLRADPG